MLTVSVLLLSAVASTPTSTSSCPYDLDTASTLIPSSCYPNYTNTADAPVTNCCVFVFMAYLFAAIRHANISGEAFLSESSSSACSDAFTSILISRRLVRPSLLNTGDRCNLDGNSTQFAAGKRPCQYSSVTDIRSAVRLSEATRRCTTRDLSSDQGYCTECQNSVVNATLTLLNVTKSKEFVPCGMAATIGIWSTSPQIRRFRSYALCMVEVLDNVGNLGTTSLIPSPPPPPPQPAKAIVTPPSPHNDRSSTVIAVSVSTVVGILAVLAGVVVLYYAFRKRRESTDDSFSVENRTTTVGSPLPTQGLYIFTKSELKQATKDFDPKLMLGEGGAGKVYLGELPSGQQVAIKRIYQKKKLDQFYREIEILAKLRHRNLTTLLGYCLHRKQHVMAFEYMAGGNLSRALYHGDLTWHQRVKIAVDVAEGLVYLHEFPEGTVIHRDVKPSNILLNESGQAKLSDFGVSKILPLEISQASTEIKGTTGYLDPEYFSLGQVSEATDVYSYGIVLLELITGKRAVVSTPSGGAESIVYRAYALMTGAGGSSASEPKVEDIADPKLGSGIDSGSLLEVFKLAYRCVKPHKHERPSMKEALEILKRVLVDIETALVLPHPQAEVISNVVSVPSISQTSTPSAHHHHQPSECEFYFQTPDTTNHDAGKKHLR